MAGRGGAGEVVNLVHFQKDRQGNVVADQFEIRPAQQVSDIGLLAGEEIIHADDVVSLVDQPLAQMRPQKAGPAGD